MSRQYLHRACKKGAPKPSKSDSEDISKTLKSNLDEVVKNIDLENKKSNYNPKIGMNWCNLPTEIRLECLKHLNFKTRCGFRGVSKFEKALIDSKKYKFEHLQITFEDKMVANGGNIWYIEAKSGNRRSEIHIRTKDRPNEKCLSAIFKHSEIKNFRLWCVPYNGCDMSPILEQLEKFAPFPFERVAVFRSTSMDFFMKTCPNLEKIDVYHHFPYKKMLKLPSLLKIKEFKLWNVSAWDLQDFLPGLVQKWIDNNVEVGKSVQFNYGIGGIVNMIAEKFADRIIEKTDKEVRIRMNNEKTQILMRSISSEERYFIRWFCSCKVIPIDVPTSEYGKGDEWIQTIMERWQGRNEIPRNAPELEAEDKEIWFFF